MAMLSAKLSGGEELIKKLGFYRLGAKKRAAEVIAVTLLQVESDAKILAPVHTGLLRASIAVDQKTPLYGTVSVNVDYGVHLEFGTAKMPAQPFLTPAFQLHKQAFLANLREALKFRF